MTTAVRSLLYLLAQAVSAVLFSPLALLCASLPSIPRGRIIALWARFNIWTLQWICGVTCEVHGAENIPARPVVVVSNHQSAWETLYFQKLFPPQSYILKWQLLWIPFFGWGLAANRPVAINRAKKVRALEQLLTQGAIRLREGRWLVIFPEGTRMPPGRPAKFQAGGAMVAVRNGAPLLPIAHNAGLFWPKNSFRKYPGVVQLRIGKPIESKGRKAQEVNAEAQAWVHQTLRELPQARA